MKHILTALMLFSIATTSLAQTPDPGLTPDPQPDKPSIVQVDNVEKMEFQGRDVTAVVITEDKDGVSSKTHMKLSPANPNAQLQVQNTGRPGLISFHVSNPQQKDGESIVYFDGLIIYIGEDVKTHVTFHYVAPQKED